MIKPRVKRTAASLDDDSPFQAWPAESEAGALEQWESSTSLEWFGAIGEAAPAAEEEINTKCTDSGAGIIGQTDRRQPVADTTALPHRWICQLYIRRKDPLGNPEETAATGVLVSPCHVLTAAHAIKEEKPNDRGGRVLWEADYIRVTPGRDGERAPFGTHAVTKAPRIAPGWRPRGDSGSEHHDYALLTLDKRIGNETFKAIGNRKLFYWGSAQCPEATAVSQDPTSLVRATGISAGYPNDRGGAKTMFSTSGQLGVTRAGQFMVFAADACQGQSGSPVWVVSGGKHQLVGLLVRVQAGSASVIPFTREVAKQLRAWMGSESDAFPAAEAEGFDVEAESIGDEASESALGESAFEEEGFEGTFEEETLEERASEESTSEENAFEAQTFEEEALEESASEDLSESFDSAEARPNDEWTTTSEFAGEEPGAEGQVPATAVTIGKLAFLTPIAKPLDPGIYNGPAEYRIAPTLQKCLMDAVAKLKIGAGSPIALVDLTKDPSAPDFAGWHHKAQTFPASIGKLIPMLAAFQLRSDLKGIRAAMPAAPLADVFAEARKRWLATQTPPSGAAVTPVSGALGRQGDLVTWNKKPITLPPKSSLPNLETIFGPAAAVEFASQWFQMRRAPACPECNEYVYLESIDKSGGDRKHKFHQRLKLMVSFSNNSAANSCLTDIGFPYIASVLLQTGLWDAARGGGLWGGAGYANLTWRGSPLGQGPLTVTVGALAALMVLIARNLAVDAGSSAAMRALLDKDAYPGGHTRSGFQDGLKAEAKRLGRSPATVFSKLGLLPGREYDCAIVERDEAGKKLRYVAVALNVPGTPLIEKLAVELDQCIRVNNGL